MSKILEEAKKVQTSRTYSDKLSDDEAVDLILAYAVGEITTVQIRAVLAKRRYSTLRTNGVNLLGSRVFGLIRRGKLKLTRV